MPASSSTTATASVVLVTAPTRRNARTSPERATPARMTSPPTNRETVANMNTMCSTFSQTMGRSPRLDRAGRLLRPLTKAHPVYHHARIDEFHGLHALFQEPRPGLGQPRFSGRPVAEVLGLPRLPASFVQVPPHHHGYFSRRDRR